MARTQNVWRFRDSAVVAPLAAGAVVAVKLFFWPLLLWFVVTRRYRSAALAASASAVLVLAPWAGIGFAGLRDYPGRLATISHVEGEHSYSLAALLHSILPSWTAAVVVSAAVGLAFVGLAFSRAAAVGSATRSPSFSSPCSRLRPCSR